MSTFEPCRVSEPPLAPEVSERSTPIVCPLSWIVPLIRTLPAACAACFASARICVGLFEASPFELELPPQPASAAVVIARRSNACQRFMAAGHYHPGSGGPWHSPCRRRRREPRRGRPHI